MKVENGIAMSIGLIVATLICSLVFIFATSEKAAPNSTVAITPASGPVENFHWDKRYTVKSDDGSVMRIFITKPKHGGDGHGT